MTKTPKAPPAGSHIWNEQVGVTVWPVYLVQAHINTADDLLAKKTPFWSLKNTLYNLWPWVQRYFWPLAFSYSISPLHTHAPFFWCIEMNGVNEEQKGKLWRGVNESPVTPHPGSEDNRWNQLLLESLWQQWKSCSSRTLDLRQLSHSLITARPSVHHSATTQGSPWFTKHMQQSRATIQGQHLSCTLFTNKFTYNKCLTDMEQRPETFNCCGLQLPNITIQQKMMMSLV